MQALNTLPNAGVTGLSHGATGHCATGHGFPLDAIFYLTHPSCKQTAHARVGEVVAAPLGHLLYRAGSSEAVSFRNLLTLNLE